MSLPLRRSAPTDSDWYNTPAGPAPPGRLTNFVDPPSIAYKISISNGVSAFVIISCIALRFSSRCFLVKAVGSDDYVMLVALLTWIATMCLFQYLNDVGQGRHLSDVRMTDYSPSFLMGWSIAAVLYSLTMMFIKLSILLLYRRVFPVGTFMFRWWFVVAFTVIYSVAGVCCSVFACWPISSAWNLWESSDYCINTAAFYLANATLNIASELLILALPLPVIWGLALARRPKIHLCMMFGVGTITCVVSVLRFRSLIVYYRHGDRDSTWDIVDMNIWSQIELTVAFVCASCPALRPLLIWIFGSFFREQSAASIPSSRSRSRSTPLRRLKPRASRELSNLELGVAGCNRTHVSSNKFEWDTESTQHMVRPGTVSQDREDKNRESGNHAIFVQTSYAVLNRVSSPYK